MTRPSLCDKLRQLAIDGMKDLAQNGPTDEEIAMAKLNLQKNIPESRQRNFIELVMKPAATAEAE